MRIQVRNSANETGFGIEVDPARPPTVVRAAEDRPPVTLDWDRALDDQLRLRRCPVCGCPDLFARKRVPQVTAFVLLLFAAVVPMALYGMNMARTAIVALVVLAVADVAIFLFAGQVLECYRCHSIFRGVPIRRGYPGWSRSVADKHRKRSAKATQPGGDAA